MYLIRKYTQSTTSPKVLAGLDGFYTVDYNASQTPLAPHQPATSGAIRAVAYFDDRCFVR